MCIKFVHILSHRIAAIRYSHTLSVSAYSLIVTFPVRHSIAYCNTISLIWV